MSTRAPSTKLTRREFFHDLSEAIRPRLPRELQNFQSTANSQLLKIHYRYPRIHYEVWPNARDNHIEIGLHFEDGPESTDLLLAYFDRHILEIKHMLGPEFELERWTQSWGHLYRHLRYQPLTDQLLDQMSELLIQMITFLQPLVEEIALPPAQSRKPPRRFKRSR